MYDHLSVLIMTLPLRLHREPLQSIKMAQHHLDSITTKMQSIAEEQHEIQINIEKDAIISTIPQIHSEDTISIPNTTLPTTDNTKKTKDNNQSTDGDDGENKNNVHEREAWLIEHLDPNYKKKEGDEMWSDQSDPRMIYIDNILRGIISENELFNEAVLHFKKRHEKASFVQFVVAFVSALLAFFSATSFTLIISDIATSCGWSLSPESVAKSMQISVGLLSLYLTKLNANIKKKSYQKWMCTFSHLRTDYANIRIMLESEIRFPRHSPCELVRQVSSFRKMLAVRNERAKSMIPSKIQEKCLESTKQRLLKIPESTLQSIRIDTTNRSSVVDLNSQNQMTLHGFQKAQDSNQYIRCCIKYFLCWGCLKKVPLTRDCCGILGRIRRYIQRAQMKSASKSSRELRLTGIQKQSRKKNAENAERMAAKTLATKVLAMNGDTGNAEERAAKVLAKRKAKQNLQVEIAKLQKTLSNINSRRK